MSDTNTMRSAGPGQEMIELLHDWAYRAVRDGRIARLVVNNYNEVQLQMGRDERALVKFDNACEPVARALVIMHTKGTISSATFIDCSTRLKKAGVPNELLMTDAEAEFHKKSFSYAEFKRMSKTPDQVLAGVRQEMDDLRRRLGFLKAAEQKLVQQIEMERRADEAKARRQAQEELARVEAMLVEAKKALQALDS